QWKSPRPPHLTALFAKQRHADYVRVKDHGVAHEALDIAVGLAGMMLDHLGDEHEHIAHFDGTAEANVFQAAEDDKISFHEAVPHDVIAAQLRRRLAHDHAGHEGVAGDVATD